MHTSLHPVVLLALAAGAVGLFSLPLAWVMKVPMRPSLRGGILASLPSLGMLGLFYSLAVHMHDSLGGWPASIGEHGFSGPLRVHAVLAVTITSGLYLGTIVGGPVLLVMFLVRPVWRSRVRYIILHVTFLIGAWLLMQLAPPEFLYWWRD